MSESRRAVVDMLLEHGSDVEAPGFLGDKPLHLAAARGYSYAVESLIAHGADPNTVDDSGGTPLHQASMQGRTEVAALLLANGANPNARSQHNVPLSLAVRFGWKDAVILLLNSGADINVTDARDMSLLEEIIHSPGSTDLEGRELVELLLERGIDPHHGEDGKGTPLHKAVRRGRRGITEILIQAGANLNARDEHGRTPLHAAVESTQLELVVLLIEAGADVNPQDSRGNTPMYYASGSGINERIKETLRRHGGTGAFGEPGR